MVLRLYLPQASTILISRFPSLFYEVIKCCNIPDSNILGLPSWPSSLPSGSSSWCSWGWWSTSAPLVGGRVVAAKNNFLKLPALSSRHYLKSESGIVQIQKWLRRAKTMQNLIPEVIIVAPFFSMKFESFIKKDADNSGCCPLLYTNRNKYHKNSSNTSKVGFQEGVKRRPTKPSESPMNGIIFCLSFHSCIERVELYVIVECWT